jgi:hypothetical protein
VCVTDLQHASILCARRIGADRAGERGERHRESCPRLQLDLQRGCLDDVDDENGCKAFEHQPQLTRETQLSLPTDQP